MEGRGRHPVLKARGALISRCVVLCRIEALGLTHAVVVFEVSRRLAVQGAGISTRGARRPVVVVCLVHVWVLLSHAGGPGRSGAPEEAESSRGASSVCKEPAGARCASLKGLLRTSRSSCSWSELRRRSSGPAQRARQRVCSCVQLGWANECGGLSTGSSRYLTTFFSCAAASRLSVRVAKVQRSSKGAAGSSSRTKERINDAVVSSSREKCGGGGEERS